MTTQRRRPPTERLRPRTHHGPVIVQRGSDFVPNEIIALITDQVEDIRDIVKLRDVSPQFRNYIDNSITIQRRLFRLPNLEELIKTVETPYEKWPKILSLHLDVLSNTTGSNDQSTPVPRFRNTPDYWKDMYVTQPPIFALQMYTRSEGGKHRKSRLCFVRCMSGINVWHIMYVLERQKELRYGHGDEKWHLSLAFITYRDDAQICNPLRLEGPEDLISFVRF
ncbi:hypothetical protein BDV97DRAFT_390334 [Delphinella strobiligena]|nr:hypothetical protein BDV97DRAFT_390334 [Delphinella strobiligena]